MLKLLLSHVRLSYLLSRRTDRTCHAKLMQDLNFYGHPVVLDMRTDDCYVAQRINMASQVDKCTW